jgi:hypothetical protein
MAGPGLKMKHSIHEVFSREEKLVAGSDRSFGAVLAAALVAVTLPNAWHSGRLWPWTGGLAALLMAAAFFRPSILNPLKRAWLKLGRLLHGVGSPIVMGLLFYGAVLPTGLVVRMMKKDLLRLKREPDAESYWIARQPPGPSPETMKNQF